MRFRCARSPRYRLRTPPDWLRSWRTGTPKAVGERRVIYLDTSGAMKLVRPEAHGDAPSQWFRERLGLPGLWSVLMVELMRATRRSAPDRVTAAANVLRVPTVAPLSWAFVRTRRRARQRPARCSGPGRRARPRRGWQPPREGWMHRPRRAERREPIRRRPTRRSQRLPS